MKKSRMNKIKLRAPITLLCCVIGLVLFGCEEKSSLSPASYPNEAVHNPNEPVIVTDFSPKQGQIPTQFIIQGSNFGSDTSMIKVMIDDVPLNVISSDGVRIYAHLGSELSDDEEKGILTVNIGEEGKEIIATAPDKFRYIVEPYVITVAGWRDENGRSESRDGPIGTGEGTAQFARDGGNGDIEWLAFDQDKNLYIMEEYTSMRVIPNSWDKVETRFRKGTLNRIRTISFSHDYSKMYIVNDQDDGEWNCPGVIELLADPNNPEESFTESKMKTIINVRQCNGAALQPDPNDQTLFFNHFTAGECYKWLGISDPIKGNDERNSKKLFMIRDVHHEFTIQFHPSGDFAYIIMINQHYILKSYYNRDTQELEAPVLFVGGQGQASHKDAVGVFARFNTPYQGVFVGDDFYICDQRNHCIRKITPDGIVSTLAGRPSSYGHTDGMAWDAQFDRPTGIVYDEDEKCFYISDRMNACIRKIILPKNE